MNVKLYHSIFVSPSLKHSVDIFTALENGVDVFDGSCVYSATERGSAVVFPIGQQIHTSTLQPLECGEADSKSCEDGNVRNPLLLEIDLNEEK